MKKTTVAVLFASLSLCAFPQSQTISADEFQRRILSAEATQLIDLRTPEEFEISRIRSAINLDIRNSAFRTNIENLDKGKPVFVYCFVELKSKASVNFFLESGFQKVYILGGGLNAWARAGKPTERSLSLSMENEISSREFDSVVSQKGYVLIDFFTSWCLPCERMLPVLQELERTYSGKFKQLSINFEKNRMLANSRNVGSVPHLILYKDGEKIWEKIGETNREELMELLEL